MVARSAFCILIGFCVFMIAPGHADALEYRLTVRIADHPGQLYQARCRDSGRGCSLAISIPPYPSSCQAGLQLGFVIEGQRMEGAFFCGKRLLSTVGQGPQNFSISLDEIEGQNTTVELFNMASAAQSDSRAWAVLRPGNEKIASLAISLETVSER